MYSIVSSGFEGSGDVEVAKLALHLRTALLEAS